MAKEVPTRLVAFGERSCESTIGNLRVRVLGNPWFVRGQRSNPVAMRVLPELCSADVVHCHQGHILGSSLAALFCRMMGRRVFVTDLGGGGWDVSAYVSTERWYDGHLHLSEYSRTGYGHRNKPFAHVISAGVDLDRFSPSAHVARTGGVLYAGRILPHKGIDVLVRAMPPDLPLWVIGREADSRYLGDLRKLGTGKQILIKNDCSDRDLVDAYRKALCVVLPSVERTLYGLPGASPELLGQTLLEAMACGAPVIGSSIGGIPEVITEGVTGFLIPPGDVEGLRNRIQWLRANPEEAAKMGDAGRRSVAEKFTWPQVVRRCLDIYRSAA
jgi:glycosyltransferase involved in cell wall biosynthesis